MGRIFAAFAAFFGILFSRAKADAWREAVAALRAEGTPQDPPADERAGKEAVHTLVLLQREGRLVDFLMEEIAAFDDAQIGAAVRPIHDGCRKALEKHFAIGPVREEAEGEKIAVPAGYDPSRLRLTGRLAGEPPMEGALRHRGWCAGEVTLPTRSDKIDPYVIQPAEIEIAE